MQNKISLSYSKLVVGRHLVGMALFLAVNPYLMAGYREWQIAWLGNLLFCIGLGALLSALATLFFTTTQSKHWLSNAIKVSWVSAILILAGSWGILQKPKPEPMNSLHSQSSFSPKPYYGEVITTVPPGMVPFTGELDKP